MSVHRFSLASVATDNSFFAEEGTADDEFEEAEKEFLSFHDIITVPIPTRAEEEDERRWNEHHGDELTVKAKWDQATRRFLVEDVLNKGSFARLKSLLTSVFADIGENVTLTYQDEEGDQIPLTGDAELKAAARWAWSCSPALLRVQVRPASGIKPPSYTSRVQSWSVVASSTGKRSDPAQAEKDSEKKDKSSKRKKSKGKRKGSKHGALEKRDLLPDPSHHLPGSEDDDEDYEDDEEEQEDDGGFFDDPTALFTYDEVDPDEEYEQDLSKFSQVSLLTRSTDLVDRSSLQPMSKLHNAAFSASTRRVNPDPAVYEFEHAPSVDLQPAALVGDLPGFAKQVTPSEVRKMQGLSITTNGTDGHDAAANPTNYGSALTLSAPHTPSDGPSEEATPPDGTAAAAVMASRRKKSSGSVHRLSDPPSDDNGVRRGSGSRRGSGGRRSTGGSRGERGSKGRRKRRGTGGSRRRAATTDADAAEAKTAARKAALAWSGPPLMMQVDKGNTRTHLANTAAGATSSWVGTSGAEAPLGIVATLGATARAGSVVERDIVLVIDTSRSMDGEPLRLVQETLYILVDQMRPIDRVCVISFNSTATTIMPMSYMTPKNTQLAKRDIGRLTVSKGTNISAGLALAYNELEAAAASAGEPSQGGTKRMPAVFLLSDGEPTEGRTSTYRICSNLEYHMQKLAADARGIVDCFGFSNHHDAVLLDAIAQAGHGTFRYIASLDGIPRNFFDQWGGLTSVVARNVSLRIVSRGESMRIVSVPGRVLPHELRSERRRKKATKQSMYSYSVSWPEFRAEERKHILVGLEHRHANTPGSVGVTCSYDDMTVDPVVRRVLKVVVTFEPGEEVPASVDLDVQYNRVLAASSIKEAALARLKGDKKRALSIMSSARQSIVSVHSMHPKPGCDDMCSIFTADLDACMDESTGYVNQSPFNPLGFGPMNNIAESHLAERPTDFGAQEGELYRNEPQKAAMTSLAAQVMKRFRAAYKDLDDVVVEGQGDLAREAAARRAAQADKQPSQAYKYLVKS